MPEIAKLDASDDEKVKADIAGLIKAKSEKALKNTDWQSFNLSRYRAGKVAERQLKHIAFGKSLVNYRKHILGTPGILNPDSPIHWLRL